MIENKEPYYQILDEIFDVIPNNPSAIALVHEDGITIASVRTFLGQKRTHPVDREEDKLSALTTVLISLGERVSIELHDNNYQYIVIGGQQGIIYHVKLPDDLNLSINWTNGLSQKKFDLSLPELSSVINELIEKLQRL